MAPTFTAYLAEPIDQSTGLAIYEAASQIESKLLDQGLNIYRPASAWRCAGNPTPTIEKVNRAALEQADLVVAYLPKGVPSIGVPIEIAMAASRRISVVVVTTTRSFTLAGIEGVTIVPRIEDVPDVVDAICRELEKQRTPKRRLVDLSRPRSEMVADIDRFNDNQQTDWARFFAERGFGTLALRRPEEAGPPAEPLPLVYQKYDDRTPDLRLAHDDDAGIDLHTIEDATVEGGGYAKISTGVRIKLPEGVFGWVVARSSTFEKYRLLVLPGIMDTGYRGPYYALVWNTQDTPVHIPAGTRLCQVVLLESVAPQYRPVTGIVPIDTTRGANGFGSTGESRHFHAAWCGLDTDHSGDCQLGPRCCAGCANGTGCDKSEAPGD